MGSIVVVFKDVNRRVQMFGTSRRVSIKDPSKLKKPKVKTRVRLSVIS